MKTKTIAAILICVLCSPFLPGCVTGPNGNQILDTNLITQLLDFGLTVYNLITSAMQATTPDQRAALLPQVDNAIDDLNTFITIVNDKINASEKKVGWHGMSKATIASIDNDTVILRQAVSFKHQLETLRATLTK